MTYAGSIQVQVVNDADTMADRIADWLIQLAYEKGDHFSLCLSGGATPKTLYQRLAEPQFSDRFPWPNTHMFFGDERFVPPADPLSNYRMVREALLDHVQIPEANVHPVPTEGVDPEQSAAAYEQTLKGFHGSDRLDPARPLFDVALLGLGEDGHTASLFPGSAVLEERTRWVAAVIGAKAEPRITLTYPALESSRHTVFLVTGAGKRDMLQRLTAGDQTLPAARINPIGTLVVFCDGAAAGM
jgi:6-phosphogluconolactonase